MKIYEKYILSKIAGPMLIITLGITGIAWLSQSLRFVDFIVNKGLSIGTFFYITVLIVPSLLWVVLPVALFISVIYSYNKLANESELIIFKTSGIDNYSLLKPAIMFASLCTIISFAIGAYLLPISYREFKDTQYFIRNNYASILLQEGVFSNPAPNLTVFIKERDYQGIFHGLLVNDERNPGKKITVMAQEGRIISTVKGPVFEMINGNHQELNPKTGQLSMLYFDKYNLQLNPFKDTMNGKRWREPPERFFKELFFSDEQNPELAKKLAAEGHYRITWPLYNFLMILIAVMPFLVGEFSRRGAVKKIIQSSMLGLFFILLSFAFKNIAPKALYLNSLMYINILLGLIIFYRITAVQKTKK